MSKQATDSEEEVRKFLPYWVREILKMLDEVEKKRDQKSPS
jgi:hypothetical protein